MFVAHTVLDDLGSLGDLWHAVPLDRPILAHYWRDPPDEVPRDRDELIHWLFDRWAKIDAWTRGTSV